MWLKKKKKKRRRRKKEEKVILKSGFYSSQLMSSFPNNKHFPKVYQAMLFFPDTSVLCLPSVGTQSLGQRSFFYAAPSVWKSPLHSECTPIVQIIFEISPYQDTVCLEVSFAQWMHSYSSDHLWNLTLSRYRLSGSLLCTVNALL